MDTMAAFLLTANALTLGWALRLLARHPNRPLRHLVLTVAVVSVSQTAVFLGYLEGQAWMRTAAVVQQWVTAMGTFAAVGLLWLAAGDRRRTDQILRLAEHESQLRLARGMRPLRLAARTGKGT